MDLPASRTCDRHSRVGHRGGVPPPTPRPQRQSGKASHTPRGAGRGPEGGSCVPRDAGCERRFPKHATAAAPEVGRSSWRWLLAAHDSRPRQRTFTNLSANNLNTMDEPVQQAMPPATWPAMNMHSPTPNHIPWPNSQRTAPRRSGLNLELDAPSDRRVGTCGGACALPWGAATRGGTGVCPKNRSVRQCLIQLWAPGARNRYNQQQQ